MRKNRMDEPENQAMLQELRRRVRAADETVQPPVSLAPCMIVRKLEREETPAEAKRGLPRRAMAVALSAVLLAAGVTGALLLGRQPAVQPSDPETGYSALFQPDLSSGKRNSYYDICLAFEQIRERQDKSKSVADEASLKGGTGLQSCLPSQKAALPSAERATARIDETCTTSEPEDETTCETEDTGCETTVDTSNTPPPESNTATSYSPPPVSYSSGSANQKPAVSEMNPNNAAPPQSDATASAGGTVTDPSAAASSKPADGSSRPTVSFTPPVDRAEDWKSDYPALYRTQEPLVDEADVVKADGDYLYILSRGREEGRLLSIVKISGDRMELCSSTQVDAPGSNPELYLSGDRLVVLENREEGIGGMAAEGVAVAQIYDITDRAQPALVRTWKQQGVLSGSRLIDGTLYINTTPYYPYIPKINEELAKNYLPRFWDSDIGRIVPLRPGQVQIIQDTDTATYCFMAAVDLSGGCQVAATLGGGDVLYSDLDNVYVAAVRQTDETTFTEIVRFTTTYPMHYTGRGRLPGAVSDSFCIDGKDGYLRVVTQFPAGEGNGLYVLDDGLAIAGGLTRIAPGQTIRSVRYEGDTAYLAVDGEDAAVIVVDLRDPAAPALSGSLRLPGFSGKLYPLDGARMLAVEEEDAGVNLTLFDVSDPVRPRRTDKYLLRADSQRLYSEAAYNHHAVTYLADKQLCFMPFAADSGFSGVLVLDLSSGAIQPRQVVTTACSANDSLFEVQKGDLARRTIVNDDVGFAVSDGAIISFDLGSFQTGFSLRLYQTDTKLITFSGVDRTPILSMPVS